MTTQRPPYWLTWLLIRQRLVKQMGHETPEGLTLIECLVAIVMIGLLTSAIAPPLVVAMSTRVQSQRIEQATEVAQSEIDAIRLIIERGGYTDVDLPLVAEDAGGDEVQDNEIATVSGPAYGDDALLGGDLDGTTNQVLIDNSVTVGYSDLEQNDTRAVDVDNDGDVDFAVQVYRSAGKTITTTDGDTQPVTFTLGVRVYDIDAIFAQNAGNLPAPDASTKEISASAGMTASENERDELPLAVLYTTIIRGDNNQAYCQYFDDRRASADDPTLYANDPPNCADFLSTP